VLPACLPSLPSFTLLTACHTMLLDVLLLPHCRLRADLAPYLSKHCQPQLAEIIADRIKRVSLRLSDRTSRNLSYCIDVHKALSALLLARQQWVLQGRQLEEQQQPEQPDEQQQGLATVHDAWQQQQQQQQMYGLAGDSGSFARSVSCGSMGSDSSSSGMGAGKSAATLASVAAAAAAAAAPRTGRGLFGLLPFGRPARAEQQEQQQQKQEDDQQQDGGSMTWSDAGTADTTAAAATAAPPLPAAAVQHSSNAFDGMFGSDSRMGVPGSLHRISAMRNRRGAIYGLTYRCGSHLCY
jgi:hypothetical protein